MPENIFQACVKYHLINSYPKWWWLQYGNSKASTDLGTHEYSAGKGTEGLKTDTILWNMGILVLSNDETKLCLNDVVIISGFALCTSKSFSGFLVTEVIKNQTFSPGAALYCWKSLLRAHENNFLLWRWMPVERVFSDFGVTWNNFE